MYWLVFTWISHVTGSVEYVMAVSNRSWRAMVGKSGAYHKSGSRRKKGEEKGVGTRGIGGRGCQKRRGKEKKGGVGRASWPPPYSHMQYRMSC